MEAIKPMESVYTKIAEYGITTSEKTSEADEDESIASMKKQNLEAMLKSCESLIKSSYSAKSWNQLMKTYANAKSLSIQESPSSKALSKAIRELASSMGRLQPAEKKKEREEERRDDLPVVIKLSAETPTLEQILAQTAVSAPTAATAEVSVAAGSIDISL